MGYQSDYQTEDPNAIDPADYQYQQDQNKTAQQALIDQMSTKVDTQPVSAVKQVAPTEKVTTEPLATAPLGQTDGAVVAGSTLPQAYGDIQAKAAPRTYHVGAADPGIASTVADIIKTQGLQANQSDPVTSMGPIVQALRAKGINAQVDYTDVNGHSGGILIDGKPYQLIDGSNNWTPLQEWADDSAGKGAGMTARAQPTGSAGGSLFGDSYGTSFDPAPIQNQMPSYLSGYGNPGTGMTPTDQAASQGSLQAAMAELEKRLQALNAK